MQCINCGKTSNLISSNLPACINCIRNYPDEVIPNILNIHIQSRQEFKLPNFPPRAEDGVKCLLCANKCQIEINGRGYCGLRTNYEGKIVHLGGTVSKGLLEWYYDPLPTNCVADGVCAEGSKVRHRRSEYKNLAVFYTACSFNCLFCQNWHYRNRVHGDNWQKKRVHSHFISAEKLASWVDNWTRCICYFGGDPAPQMPHSIRASQIALKNASFQNKSLRICWETNGTMSSNYLKKAADIALVSGGCIKFDLKAFNENLNIALCGVSNKATLENFKYLAQRTKERPQPPLLIASTPLIPGYIDAEEVYHIAKFIANENKEIPYTLLAHYPCFYLPDLPTTSREQSHQCYDAAVSAGLKNIRIGNIHLLS